ncbi:Nucleoside diphosphate kinase [Candidatus Tremblaya princeps]|uniref:Nucleoside diphosphate kinase n=1 Tax=Tremblaya princeps TaxID=189385 RepID=A0A143WNW5_TREPR|nr:Nucleoside diphosphate kinase [Candidatus Tremblaya princeps]
MCAGYAMQALRMIARLQAFFDRMKEFMTSGIVVVQVLCGHNVVRRHRELIGSTRPCEAAAAPFVGASVQAQRQMPYTAQQLRIVR